MSLWIHCGADRVYTVISHGAGWGVRLVDCVGSQDWAPVASMAPALPRAAKSYREGDPQGAGARGLDMSGIHCVCVHEQVCVTMHE